MKRWWFLGGAASAGAGALLGARPRPTPTPIPSPDPEAEALYGQARAWWKVRTDVPYLQYGALIRYKHAGQVFDNWWNAAFRSSDHVIHLDRIVIAADEAKRLRGFPISLFGFKIGDTNPNAEPIRVEEPFIDPISDFGVLTRYRSGVNTSAVPTPNPLAEPEPNPTQFREIGRVEAATRDYDVRLVGSETLRYCDTYHLRLTPLRDPATFRLRDLWISQDDSATVQVALDGIFNGKPYDSARWTVTYVPINSHWYVQQVWAKNLRFGFDIGIEAMEFDFVDYHFPHELPAFTFEKLL